MTAKEPDPALHRAAQHLPNPAGEIFGGWIMSQMDHAAGNAAARISQGRRATVAVEGMSFHSQVEVGDEVTVWARLIRRGHASMTL